MVELISVHLPKCAGTSFKYALERVYSPEAIYYDYDDRPADPSSPMNLDPEGFLERHRRQSNPDLAGKKVVHGHFYIRKYEGVRQCARIVFIREPIARLISHYYFWLNIPKHGHALHDYVLGNRISLLQFSRLPSLRYFYTGVFFRDVDMKAFDFVGVYENMEKDLKRLSRMLGKDLVLELVNANPDQAYAERWREVMDDRKLVSELRESLADDTRFYEKVTGLG